MLNPIAYLTCELKSRDLASRLLIASRLADRGYPVIVGQQWSIFSNLRSCPKGAVLFKTANKTQADWMTEAQANGHMVITSDEERLAAAPTDYVRSTHPAAMQACHAFLAINDLHAQAIKEAFPAAAQKVTVAGNTRIDILRSQQPPRPMAEPYILINTSFGQINHISGSIQEAVNVWIGSGGFEINADTERMIRERVDFEKQAMVETIALIDWLIANSAVQIVIRPHPTERPETWRTRFQEHSRVHIEIKSDPVTWMRHALLLVHSESTTGVEAAVMGAKALNLSPPSPWSDRYLLSLANVTVSSAAEAAALIANLLSTGAWPLAKQDIGALFPPGAAEKTADAIASHLPAPSRMSTGFSWHKITRTDRQREKFTVTSDEVRALVKQNVTQLDDSVFLLSPGS